MHTKGDNENVPKGDNKSKIKNTNPKRKKKEKENSRTTKKKKMTTLSITLIQGETKEREKGAAKFLYPICSYRLIVIIFTSSY